jgi:nucleotide-binding universal stress UspA family protein
MSYKTILVHVDESARLEERINIAAKVAVKHDAHLIGAGMTGISRLLYQSGTFGFVDPATMAINLDFLAQRTERSLARFESIVKTTEVNSFEKRLIDDEPGGGLSLQARYCDLVVIGQTDLAEPSASVMNDFPEYVVIHGGRPVLMVPYAGHFDTIGSKVLIAWDASMEATHAVTNALPFLKQAEIVEVVAFNPHKRAEKHGEQPGSDIALYLARHGINVDVAQQTTGVDIGNALLSCVADFGSDLVVMGGYGHSRFREVLLGGVTRTVLKSMTVPVLMSH